MGFFNHPSILFALAAFAGSQISHALPHTSASDSLGISERRPGSAGAFITGLTINGGTAQLNGIKGGGDLTPTMSTSTSCCEYSDNSCLTLNGNDGQGNDWAVCYFPGTDKVSIDDGAAANCNTNLHFTQSDVCIGFDNSMCSYGGVLKTGHMSMIAGTKADDMGTTITGTSPNQWNISPQESRIMQGAIDSFVGSTMSWGGGGGISYGFEVCTVKNTISNTCIKFQTAQGDGC